MNLIKNIKISKLESYAKSIFGNNIDFVIILLIIITMLKIYESNHIFNPKYYLKNKKNKNNTININNNNTNTNNNNTKNIEGFSSQITNTELIKNKYDDQEFNDNINKLIFGSSSLSKKIYENNKYINNLNILNVKARNFDSLEKLKYQYKNNSLSDINNTEKEATKWIIKVMLKKLNKVNDTILTNFILKNLLNKKTIIVKCKEFIEKGYPHTHKNIILLPESWFNELVIKYKLNLQESALNNEGITLLHELVHIHQRTNPEGYDNLYKEWGFKQPKYIHNINEILSSSRHNPDGTNLKWVWTHNMNHYFISAVYKANGQNGEEPDLTKVNYKIYKLNKLEENIFKNIEPDNIFINTNNKNSLLETNNNFQQYFGISMNHYHPNEIVAQYMEFVLHDTINQSTTIKTKGYHIFKNHLKNKNLI